MGEPSQVGDLATDLDELSADIHTTKRDPDLALATAKIDKQFEQIRSIRAMSREIEDVRVSTKQLSLELQALLSKEDTVLAAQVSAEQQRNQIVQARQEILRKYQDNLDTIAEKSAKLAPRPEQRECLHPLGAGRKAQRDQQRTERASWQPKPYQDLDRALPRSTFRRPQDAATERESAFQDIVVGRLQPNNSFLELETQREEKLGLPLRNSRSVAKSQLERKMIDNTQRLEDRAQAQGVGDQARKRICRARQRSQDAQRPKRELQNKSRPRSDPQTTTTPFLGGRIDAQAAWRSGCGCCPKDRSNRCIGLYEPDRRDGWRTLDTVRAADHGRQRSRPQLWKVDPERALGTWLLPSPPPSRPYLWASSHLATSRAVLVLLLRCCALHRRGFAQGSGRVGGAPTSSDKIHIFHPRAHHSPVKSKREGRLCAKLM